MAQDPFRSAWAKLRRAGEHSQVLDRALRSFGKDIAVSTGHEKNADATKHTLRLYYERAIPAERWGLILADCLQNLRASLDHAVYGLSVAVTGKNPPASAGSLAFPICDSPDRFAGAIHKKGGNKLGVLRLNARIVEAIEELQPYRRPHPTHGSMLAFLQELNNTDKHQGLRFAAAATRSFRVRFRNRPPDAHIVELWKNPLHVVEHGAVLVSVTFSSPAPDVEVVPEEAHLLPVVCHEFVPAGGNATEITWLMRNIGTEVRHCVDTIASLLPEPPD